MSGDEEAHKMNAPDRLTFLTSTTQAYSRHVVRIDASFIHVLDVSITYRRDVVVYSQ